MGSTVQEAIENLGTNLRTQLETLSELPGGLFPLLPRLIDLPSAFLPPRLSLTISKANQAPHPSPTSQQGPLHALEKAIGRFDATLPSLDAPSAQPLPRTSGASKVHNPAQLLKEGLDSLANPFSAAGPVVDRLLDGPDFP
jgi:hypothetical protein